MSKKIDPRQYQIEGMAPHSYRRNLLTSQTSFEVRKDSLNTPCPSSPSSSSMTSHSSFISRESPQHQIHETEEDPITPAHYESIQELEEPICFKEDHEAYFKSAEVSRQATPEQELSDALAYLKDRKIQAVKYNYSMDNSVQNFQSYKCELSLSEDEKNFVVRIFKPVIQSIDRARELGAQAEKLGTENLIQFTSKLSSASCKVDDIQAITLGAQASRFWMFRKHINSIPTKQASQVPFFAWECLTIHLKNRSLDLVVRNEKEMRILLRFLVYTLKTVDGQKNSAVPFIEAMTKKEIRNGGLSRRLVSFEKASAKLQREVEHRVMRKTLLGFHLLIIRNKISFHAYQKGMTVPELLLKSILSTVYLMDERGAINIDKDQEEAFDQLFSNKTKDGRVGVKVMVMAYAIRQLAIGNSGLSQKKQDRKGIKESAAHTMGQMSINFIRKYFQKDEVIEILRDIPEANQNADDFQHWNYSRFFNYKINLKSCNILLRRIKLFMALGLMKGLLYLKVMIRRVELKKQKLILEIEQGKEVYVDKDLGLSQLPASFRFYDFLLQYIAMKVSDDRKEYYGLKKGLNVTLHKRYNSSFMERVLRDPGDKQVFKVELNDPSRKFDIDFMRSEHTMDVQYSKYLSIDNDLTIKPNHYYSDAPKTIKQQRDQPRHIGNLKYQPSGLVARNQRDLLKFKATYSAKQAHQRGLGKRIQILQKVERWLEEEGRAKFTNPLERERYEKTLLQVADRKLDLKTRRNRVKEFTRIKSLFLGPKESELKSIQLDKIITNNHRYFAFILDEKQKEITRIQQRHKQVEKFIRQKSAMALEKKPSSLDRAPTPKSPFSSSKSKK